MRIQLDALGGVAGDMFVAALLDAFPEHEPGVLASIAAVLGPNEARCRLVAHNDGVFQGRRFEVAVAAEDHRHEHGGADHGHAHAGGHHHHDHHDHDHHHHHDHDHHPHRHAHGHESWRSIRARLEAAALDPAVLHHALGVFGRLAEAEAQVHGVEVDAVQFHEVGAADSIADIVGAAHLIAAVGAARWTVSALPLGSGRVRTAHGLMPVPAPATALLLQGFPFLDDGAPGERVTPTGAAILRHLIDPRRGEVGPAGTLARTGAGFGTRILPGVSNCLRVLAFDAAAGAGDWRQDAVTVLEFEVDDQTAEDLALGLDRLRDEPGVIDVLQAPVFGKKGRLATAVRLLARPEAANAATGAVFRQTTTLGVRRQTVGRAVLDRTEIDVSRDETSIPVKLARRPDGLTAKAEAEAVAAGRTQAERSALRREAESRALAERDGR